MLKLSSCCLDRHGNVHTLTGGSDRIAENCDIAAMTAAVSDQLLDQIAVARTADECRAQLERYGGLLDHVLLYSPSFRVRPDRVKENYQIMQTFGPAHAAAGK